MQAQQRVEVVRGQLSAARGEELIAFWTAHGALTQETARQRLDDVVCLLLDEAGAVRGVNSVYADDVPLIGKRRFWIYRRFLPGDVDDEAESVMVNAAFDRLEQEFSDRDGEPLGLCFFVEEALAQRHAAAVWPTTQLLYAGYLADGRQVRIRYFDGARIA